MRIGTSNQIKFWDAEDGAEEEQALFLHSIGAQRAKVPF